MKPGVHLFLSALVSTFATVSFLFPLASFAQMPNQQFGIGGSLAPSRNISGIITTSGGGGVYGTYAVSPSVHINAGFGLEILNVEEVNATLVGFSASGKFFFGGSGLFHPFANAGFSFSNQSLEGVSRSFPGISAGVGAQYFANRNFGAYLGISVIRVQFGDVSATTFGIGNPYIGMEWFF